MNLSRIELCVAIFVVHDDAVLLRRHDKHGVWLAVGGHVEEGEFPLVAAVREVKEEVGLDVEIIPVAGIPRINEDGDVTPPVAMHRYLRRDGVTELSFVYFARSTTRAWVQQDEVEHSEEIRWCALDELESMEFRPNVLHYARCALRALHNT